MLATAGGEECYLLLCNNRGSRCLVSPQFAQQRIPTTSPDHSIPKNMVLAVSRAEKTVLLVVAFLRCNVKLKAMGWS